MKALFCLLPYLLYCFATSSKLKGNETFSSESNHILHKFATQSRDVIFNLNSKRNIISKLFTHLSDSQVEEELSKEDPADILKLLMKPPILTKISVSFILGYSSGFFCKKVASVFSFILGGTFISVQLLSYLNYITIHFDRIQSDFNKLFDLNEDGRADYVDFETLYKKVSI